MARYGKASQKGKKFSALIPSVDCGRRFKETHPEAVKPPGSFAPTEQYPISQRKRMAGID